MDVLEKNLQSFKMIFFICLICITISSATKQLNIVGIYVLGGQIGEKIESSNFNNCSALCEANSNCTHFSFDEIFETCELKQREDMSFLDATLDLKSINLGIITGRVNSSTGIMRLGTCGLPNEAFDKASPKFSAEECIDRCRKNPTCTHLVYTSNMDCFTMTNDKLEDAFTTITRNVGSECSFLLNRFKDTLQGRVVKNVLAVGNQVLPRPSDNQVGKSMVVKLNTKSTLPK